MSKLNSRYRECSNSSVRFEKFQCFMCKLIVLFVVFVSTNSFKSNQDLHQLVFVRLQRSPLFYYFPFWHMSGTIQSKINTPVVYGGRWAGAILTLLSWILLLIRNLINKTKGLKSRRLRSEKSRLLGLDFTKVMQDHFQTWKRLFSHKRPFNYSHHHLHYHHYPHHHHHHHFQHHLHDHPHDHLHQHLQLYNGVLI